MNWKNSIYKDYLKNVKTNYYYINLQYTISEVSAAISKGKDEYHSASKCTSLVYNSTLPNSLQYVSAARLSSFYFNEEVILKIIYALNINKAHGHDDISIRMIKLCSKSVIKPLSIIFKNYIKTGTFPDIWKRSNIIPVHKNC